ncbi:MAG: AAA family ATPase [Anaerobiospirillum sp.]|nr:AAA family ATPase [Anaerobiospirillum sp.]
MDFDALVNKLPLANQSFADLRQDGSVYVDKTIFVNKIANRTIPQILTRPRRFGKSTLLTTLEELFRHGVKPYDGHPSLFQGLAIEQLWQDEKTYPVLRLNFHNLNSKCDTAAQFEQRLMRAIANFCDEQQLDVIAKLESKLVSRLVSESPSVSDLFSAMLELMPRRSLVLLVDEFDAPIIYHYNQEKELNACKLIIRVNFSRIGTPRLEW